MSAPEKTERPKLQLQHGFIEIERKFLVINDEWRQLAVRSVRLRDGLIAADPAGKDTYQANAEKFLAAIDQEDMAVRAAIGKLPPARRKIITTHDAFGYFGDDYRMQFIAPEGMSTESEASARDLADIIAQVKTRQIPAVFLENVTNPRLLQQIAKETGAKIGGTLYSDALSAPNGPAGSYIDMMRNNVHEFERALTPSGGR